MESSWIFILPLNYPASLIWAVTDIFFDRRAMVSGQNLCGGTKRSAEKDAMPKNAFKKPYSSISLSPLRRQKNIASRTSKTPTKTQDINDQACAALAGRSLATATPIKMPPTKDFKILRSDALTPDKLETLQLESPSPVTPRRRRKAAMSNQRPSTNRSWEVFGEHDSTD